MEDILGIDLANRIQEMKKALAIEMPKVEISSMPKPIPASPTEINLEPVKELNIERDPNGKYMFSNFDDFMPFLSAFS